MGYIQPPPSIFSVCTQIQTNLHFLGSRRLLRLKSLEEEGGFPRKYRTTNSLRVYLFVEKLNRAVWRAMFGSLRGWRLMVQEICSICKEGKLLSVKKEEHVEVKEFSCGHKIEKIESTWVKGFVLLDPVTDLKQAISRRAWFEGIVIATTYFGPHKTEHAGEEKQP